MSRQALSEEDVRVILRLLSEAGHVTEFRLRYADLVIEVRNSVASVEEHSPSAQIGERDLSHADASAGSGETDAEAAAAVAQQPQPSWVIVRAPMAGIVRIAGDGVAPLDAIAGKRCAPDTVVCAIEADGTMNPIPVGTAGVVRALLADDGEAVHAGQALVAIVAAPSD